MRPSTQIVGGLSRPCSHSLATEVSAVTRASANKAREAHQIPICIGSDLFPNNQNQKARCEGQEQPECEFSKARKKAAWKEFEIV